MLGPVNTLDPSSLSNLKLQTGDGSAESNKLVARQFEALFLQQVMKSMRATVPDDGIFSSESTRFFQGLHDQQFAQVMSERGGLGLAKVIERQLNMLAGVQADPEPLQIPLAPRPALPAAGPSVAGAGSPANAVTKAPRLGTPYSASAQGFVSEVWPQATQAARQLGVPAHFLVAQAALETGWGKSVIRDEQGNSSHNLFNIKAGKGWQGKVVEASTIEYENGQAVRRTERFRAYDSYAQSFEDYARLIGNASRYADVRGQQDAQGFARALQAGGYATDPAYADKLTRVINGSTLREGMLASAR